MAKLDLPAAFFSKTWLALYQREAQKLLNAAGSDAQKVCFVITEVYKNAPAELEPNSSGAVGTTVTIVNGRVTVANRIAEDFDLKVEALWEDAVRSGAMTSGPELAEFMKWRVENGRLKITGDLAKAPSFMAPLHDLLAQHTLPPA